MNTVISTIRRATTTIIKGAFGNKSVLVLVLIVLLVGSVVTFRMLTRPDATPKAENHADRLKRLIKDEKDENNKVSYLMSLADTCRVSNDDKCAAEASAEAAKLQPERADVTLRLASAAEQNGDKQAALGYYRKALELLNKEGVNDVTKPTIDYVQAKIKELEK